MSSNIPHKKKSSSIHISTPLTNSGTKVFIIPPNILNTHIKEYAVKSGNVGTILQDSSILTSKKCLKLNNDNVIIQNIDDIAASNATQDRQTLESSSIDMKITKHNNTVNDKNRNMKTMIKVPESYDEDMKKVRIEDTAQDKNNFSKSTITESVTVTQKNSKKNFSENSKKLDNTNHSNTSKNSMNTTIIQTTSNSKPKLSTNRKATTSSSIIEKEKMKCENTFTSSSKPERLLMTKGSSIDNNSDVVNDSSNHVPERSKRIRKQTKFEDFITPKCKQYKLSQQELSVEKTDNKSCVPLESMMTKQQEETLRVGYENQHLKNSGIKSSCNLQLALPAGTKKSLPQKNKTSFKNKVQSKLNEHIKNLSKCSLKTIKDTDKKKDDDMLYPKDFEAVINNTHNDMEIQTSPKIPGNPVMVATNHKIKVKKKETNMPMNKCKTSNVNDNTLQLGSIENKDTVVPTIKSTLLHKKIERRNIPNNLQANISDISDVGMEHESLEEKIVTTSKLLPDTKHIVHIIDTSTPKNVNTTESNEKEEGEEQNLSVTPSCSEKRKRGRPRKNVTPLEQQQCTTDNRTRNKSYNVRKYSDLSDSSDNEDIVEDIIITKKRGRPPDTEYLPRGANSQRVKEKHEVCEDTEIIDGGAKVTQPVLLMTCGKCEKDIPRNQWGSHNLYKHNNMGWKKNEEPLDFENDIKLLRRVLMAAIKRRRGQLTCEKCGAIKRSANGFISHMQFCGKTEKERRALLMTCPICEAVMMPSSMEMHERYHRQLEQSKFEKAQLCMLEYDKSKRKAAEKAVSKILEFTELVKDDEQSAAKKMKLDTSLLKNIIKPPELKKKIPPVWKGKWKKELVTKGKTFCRQPGCTYECTSYEDICQHFSECNFTPQKNFICKMCKFLTDSDEEMMKHVAEAHVGETHVLEETVEKQYDFEEDENESDDSLNESFNLKRSQYRLQSNYEGIRPINKMKFLENEQVQKPCWNRPYIPTFRWTMEFELEHYDLQLFDNYVPNKFTLLENDDATKHLPELEISMGTNKQTAKEEEIQSNNIKWKYWKRFEGAIDDGISTFFTGGPVWALAWLPIPAPMYSKENEQYLAVSTHHTMEAEYTVGKAYSGKNIIQIWNLGHFNYKSNKVSKPPSLSYAIAHNNGTIWCLEWCPSGCYQDKNLFNYDSTEIKSTRRMGLLAAACSDGSVYVYSLPFPDEILFKSEENKWPIYKTDPVITLVVNILMYDNNEQNWQCTKLSWTKESGHNIIAAGFSNGCIALWDLTVKSPLSMEKRNNTWFINAFHHFHAHGNSISMVALVPYNGERFLASASTDRTYKFWDLEKPNIPITSAIKGIIVDGAWMTHWPCAVVSFDDGLGFRHTNSYLISIREHGYKFYPILSTNAPTYTVAVSDRANSIAHGTLSGDVLTIFPHHVLHGREIEKVMAKKRQLSSFIKTVDFMASVDVKNNANKKQKKRSKDYQYMPETYNECKDRFGIIFCDNPATLKYRAYRGQPQKILNPENLTSIPIEQYPFTSANRVAWNPNPWSHLWLAIGYQNGLVRLLNFKFSGREVNVLGDICVKSGGEFLIRNLEILDTNMGINPLKWKTRNVVYTFFVFLLLYVFFIYKKKHHMMSEAIIKDTDPKHVWEFVADFSNMKKLNPTIEDFNIIAESGNYDHWKYSVEYTEHLSHLPSVRNVAHGHYAVRPENNSYLISSKHMTCFLLNSWCLESISQFRFDRDGAKDTKCIETVQYECPIAFSSLCHKEVVYQRHEIMKRLGEYFASVKSKTN
ncbi:hypothetical protein KM043_002796 [Ampulex compressa]|nr:hypothetical protein KM043_002796 [Ampulex compressa]